jgi:negative regulator of sigma-B (phosphoserine phosphatase)
VMKGARVDWSAASRARAGEKESGDRCVVTEQPNGTLLAVADGLGHGAEAALAADLAVRTVERYATEALTEIVKRCHQNLLRTRGVALSLARWDPRDREMTWIGVGNVEGLLLQKDGGAGPPTHRLVLRGGVVGVRLPALQVAQVTVEGEGLLILATDGIGGEFDQNLDPLERPQILADRIMATYSRDTDDAMVLVARLGGGNDG